MDGLIALVVFALITYYILFFPIPATQGIDWINTYRQIGWAVLSGQSPYLVKTFFNPFWVALMAAPFAALPGMVGRLGWLALGCFGFCAAFRRISDDRISLMLFLFSATVWRCLLNGNIDWLPYLGVGLSPWIGIWFVVIKPQIGLLVALVWLYQAYCTHGLQKTIWQAGYFAIPFLLALYGMLHGAVLMERTWNRSTFPFLIPLGLYLLYRSLKQRQPRIATGAGVFLSPYVAGHSYSALQIAFPARKAAIVFFILSWVGIALAMI